MVSCHLKKEDCELMNLLWYTRKGTEGTLPVVSLCIVDKVQIKSYKQVTLQMFHLITRAWEWGVGRLWSEVQFGTADSRLAIEHFGHIHQSQNGHYAWKPGTNGPDQLAMILAQRLSTVLPNRRSLWFWPKKEEQPGKAILERFK